MQNSMLMLAFSVLDQKYCLWANLVQKIKIVILNWNLVLRLIWIAEFNGDAHFFCFGPEILFKGKFGRTNQNLL